MPSAYYRTDDPIENFKIRVGVREISRSKTYTEDAGNYKPFVYDSILSWQKKLYSPSDVADYLQNKDSKHGTVAQFETRRHFANLEAQGQKAIDLLDSDVMLYTYVDKDYFNVSTIPPVQGATELESYLGQAASSGINDAQYDLGTASRQKGLSNKLFRDKPYKSMHICLATDINKAGLTQKPIWGIPNDFKSHYKEHILCSIKLYQVSPSLSTIAEESSSGDATRILEGATSAHNLALSPFMDDRTAEAAIKKGFRLSTNHVRSYKGDEYEYIVYNTNDILIPHRVEDVLKAQALQDALSAAQNKGSKNWKQDPPPHYKHKTLTYYAEIVSGTQFEGDQLYVNYRVKVPKGWELRVGNLSDGVANTDGAGADEGQTVTLDPHQSVKTQAAKARLRGTTHTARVCDTPRGTLCAPQLSLMRPHYRGHTLSPNLTPDLGTRLILGTALFIVTIIAIVVGAEFPVWFVPALVIVFTVGTGYPGGNVMVALLKDKKTNAGGGGVGGVGSVKKTLGSGVLSSTRTSHLHASRERIIVGQELVSPTVAVFNHLLSFSFDIHDAEDASAALGSTTAATATALLAPVIQLQVYSVGSLFGRQKLEGCGYLNLTTLPGAAPETEIKTWKPLGGVHSRMVDFFLGSSVRLKDENFVDYSSVGRKNSRALNKFGFLTESSGSVRFRYQVVLTDPRIVTRMLESSEEAARLAAEGPATAGGTQLKRTVHDILQSFKSASTKSRSNSVNVSQAFTPLGTPAQSFSGPSGAAAFALASANSSGEKPSVMSIMSALNATSKQNKVAEILARTRAKQSKNAEEAKRVLDAEKASTIAPTANTPYDPYIPRLRRVPSNSSLKSEDLAVTTPKRSPSMSNIFGGGRKDASKDAAGGTEDPSTPLATGRSAASSNAGSSVHVTPTAAATASGAAQVNAGSASSGSSSGGGGLGGGVGVAGMTPRKVPPLATTGGLSAATPSSESKHASGAMTVNEAKLTGGSGSSGSSSGATTEQPVKVTPRGKHQPISAREPSPREPLEEKLIHKTHSAQESPVPTDDTPLLKHKQDDTGGSGSSSSSAMASSSAAAAAGGKKSLPPLKKAANTRYDREVDEEKPLLQGDN